MVLLYIVGDLAAGGISACMTQCELQGNDLVHLSQNPIPFALTAKLQQISAGRQRPPKLQLAFYSSALFKLAADRRLVQRLRWSLTFTQIAATPDSCEQVHGPFFVQNCSLRPEIADITLLAQKARHQFNRILPGEDSNPSGCGFSGGVLDRVGRGARPADHFARCSRPQQCRGQS